MKIMAITNRNVLLYKMKWERMGKSYFIANILVFFYQQQQVSHWQKSHYKNYFKEKKNERRNREGEKLSNDAVDG